MPATVIVTIDLDDLLDRCGYGRSSDGTLIPTAIVLQMANNADIIPAVLNASGAVLDLGRSRRIASHHQTLALTARDVAAPSPAVTGQPNGANGTTSKNGSTVAKRTFDNLTLLCRYHHHNFATRGWTCQINTDGLPEWTPPGWADRTRTPLINTRISRQPRRTQTCPRGHPSRS